MRKKSKLTLALAVCSVSAAFAGLALSNTTVQAMGEPPAATFAMVKGAGVRAMKDQAGIRWATNVTEAWVTDTNNIPADATDVQFGTLVTSVNNVTVDGKIDVEKLTATTAEVQDLPCDVQPTYEDGTFTYYSAITYDLTGAEWTDELKQQAYATELIARSYVRYKASGSEDYTYVYAEAENTNRCMRVVALAAYEETDETKKLTEAQKGYVRGYFGDEYAANFGGYYETAVGSEDATFKTKDGQDSAYTAAYYQFAELASEAADGKISIDGLTEGETYAVTLFDDNGNYAKTTFQYITRLLYQDEENSIDTFKDVIYKDGAAVTINGYYVLGSPIDLDGTYYGVSNTFAGTLDGNGKTISGIVAENTSTGLGGLFKTLSGTVKNVAVKGKLAMYGGLIAGTCNGKAKIQNVYVEAELPTSKTLGVLARQCSSATVENVVIKVDWNKSGTPGAVFSYTGQNATTIQNCYYISVEGLTPLRAGTWTNTTYCWMGNEPEKVLGTAGTSGNVTTYTKTDGTKTVTSYTADNLESAQSAFDAAVKAKGVTLTDELKALMGIDTEN